MDELKQIDQPVKPDQVYLVFDAMTGQDAVNSAKAFNEALELDGVILTKLDGDARGGAALSVKAVTGVPIKFIGIGEKLDALRRVPPRAHGPAHPRAGRHPQAWSSRRSRSSTRTRWPSRKSSCAKGEFTLDDFRKLLGQIKQARPAQQDHGHDPRHGRHVEDARRHGRRRRHEAAPRHHRLDDARRAPQPQSKTIDQSRRRRIAAGAGVEPHDVNDLVKQFDAMADDDEAMASMGMSERMREMKQLSRGASRTPSAQLAKQKEHRQTAHIARASGP